MVILKAFIESDCCASWCEVWRGDSLKELDKATFNYFKTYYRLDNLALVCTFEASEDFDFDDFFENDF